MRFQFRLFLAIATSLTIAFSGCAQDSASKISLHFVSRELSRVSADSTYHYQFLAVSTPGTVVRYRITLHPPWIKLNAAGLFLFGKTAKAGQYPIHIEASDGTHSVVQYFMLTVYNKETQNILPLGNSITNGTSTFNSYRRALWKLLHAGNYNFDFIGSWSKHHLGGKVPDPDFDLDHDGHSGWTIDNMLTQPDWDSARGNLSVWLRDYSPDIVLIELGTNDVFQCIPVDTAMKRLSRIVDMLREKNTAVSILIAQIPPLGKQWSAKSLCGTNHTYADDVKHLNTRIGDFAQEHTSATSVIEIVDQFTGIIPAKMMYDDIHPNEAGEQEMAERWFAVIQKYLKKLK